MKFFVFMMSLAVALPTFAAQKKQDANAVVARATASFVNRMSNVEEFLNVMSKSVSPEQMDRLKKQLSHNNVKLTDKFPKMKFERNKVYFDKNNYMIYVDENTVNVNGVEFKKGVKNIDVVYKEVMAKIGKKSASHFSIIPEAYALGDLGGLLGLVAGGGLGYFLGPAIGLSAGWGAVLGAGAFFLGNELYQSWRSGEVRCDNGFYLYRSKSRSDSGIFASSTDTALDQATLSRIFGPNVPPCHAASAKMAEKGIKKFGGLPQPQGDVPYQGYTAPAYQEPQVYQPQPADVSK